MIFAIFMTSVPGHSSIAVNGTQHYLSLPCHWSRQSYNHEAGSFKLAMGNSTCRPTFVKAKTNTFWEIFPFMKTWSLLITAWLSVEVPLGILHNWLCWAVSSAGEIMSLSKTRVGATTEWIAATSTKKWGQVKKPLSYHWGWAQTSEVFYCRRIRPSRATKEIK